METRLFPEGTVPEYTTPEWYAGRETAPHLEQDGHRERLLLTADFVRDAIARGAKNIVDVGAGDGGLLSLFKDDSRVESLHGYDLQQTNADASKNRGIEVFLQDVLVDESWTKEVKPDTVLIATEMLEHLIYPHQFVKKLYDTGAEFFVASSPHTETAELHYEFHTWAWDLQGYRALLEGAGWRVVRQETCWISQVLLAVQS